MADERDRQDFTALVRRHDPRLRAVAYKLLGGDRARMDDVMQDAYLRAFRSYADFRGDAAVTTWLHRIVYNACIDELRRSRRRPPLHDIDGGEYEPQSTHAGPERVVAGRDLVMRALATLPPDQRATVLLVDGEGFDHTEVAEILSVAPGTVASRLSRARTHMRRALGEEGR